MKTLKSRNKTRCFFLMFSILLLISCENENSDKQILLNSIELSNNVYIENVKQLRGFFESKFDEEPSRYEETFNKIRAIEYEKTIYSELTTIKEKKNFIEDVILKFKSNFQLDNIEFVCLSMDDTNLDLFNSISENDFNRNLYIIYKEFYNYHHPIF